MGHPILIRKKRWTYAPFNFCVDCGAEMSRVPQRCGECKKFHDQEEQFGEAIEAPERLLMLAAKALFYARRARKKARFERHAHLMSKYHKFWMQSTELVLGRSAQMHKAS